MPKTTTEAPPAKHARGARVVVRNILAAQLAAHGWRGATDPLGTDLTTDIMDALAERGLYVVKERDLINSTESE